MAQPFVRRIDSVKEIKDQEIIYSETADLLVEKGTGNIYIITKDKTGLPIPQKERITYQLEVEDLQKRMTKAEKDIQDLQERLDTAETNIDELQNFMRQQYLYNDQFTQQQSDMNQRITALENK